MLILLNGGNFSLTVLVHNMFLISIEKHQTQQRSPPRHPVVLHQSFQCPNWRSHFEADNPLPDSVDIFFTMTSQQKKLWINREGSGLLNYQWRHYLTIDSFVSDMSRTRNFLNTNHWVIFEGQFNSSETNYSIPFERWCNRLSSLSN